MMTLTEESEDASSGKHKYLYKISRESIKKQTSHSDGMAKNTEITAQ